MLTHNLNVLLNHQGAWHQYKMKDENKFTIEMRSQILNRVANFGYFENSFLKRYKVNDFWQSPWRILRPHLATLKNLRP